MSAPGEPGPEPERMPTLLGAEGTTRCTVDWIEYECGATLRLMEAGAAARCPNDDCRQERRYNPATGQYEWRFFRAFADGYEGYVPIGATSRGDGYIERSDRTEGLARLHHSQNSIEQNLCEQFLAGLFGGKNAIMRTRYEVGGAYRGVAPEGRENRSREYDARLSNTPYWDFEHLYNFPHLTGNIAGTENTDIFIPDGYDPQSITRPSLHDGVVTVYYKKLGDLTKVTLAIFHVADFHVQRINGRTRIGRTGGPGGDSSKTPPNNPNPNKHSHFELWKGKTGGVLKAGDDRNVARIPFLSAFSACR